MRRATPRYILYRYIRRISIHTLHAEGDPPRYIKLCCKGYFNPHPPCGGRLKRINTDLIYSDISIHTLHAEGDGNITSTVIMNRVISIHTLHAEGDLVLSVGTAVAVLFQSTPSMRRATKEYYAVFVSVVISIHTLHAESDHYCGHRGGRAT